MIIWNKMYTGGKSGSTLIQSKTCIYYLEEKRQRSESNDSDQSNVDHLPQKQEVSKKHKSFESVPSYDISIGHGKEPASGRSYQKKGIPSESESSLPTKRKGAQKGNCSVLIKSSFYYNYYNFTHSIFPQVDAILK